MLHDSGLLREVLPEVEWNAHLAQCLEKMESGIETDLAAAILLHETSAENVETMMERLKFSRAEINHTVCLIAQRPRFRSVRNMKTSALKRFFRLPRFEDHLMLEHVCRTASQSDLDDYTFVQETFRGWTSGDISPAPLITGED